MEEPSGSVGLYFKILEVIGSELQLSDSYLKEGVPTFIIVPDYEVEEKITRVRSKLGDLGIDMILERRNGNLVLQAVKLGSGVKSTSKILKKSLPLILFIATIITVTVSGYLSVNDHIALLKFLGRLNLTSAQENIFRLKLTALYTISVMGVLGLHELGHMIACRIHNVKASLPFFIPGIPPVGTFGAVIKQESPVLNRNHLFDIGLMGPLFGFIGALIVSYFGYSWSIPVSEAELGYIMSETGTIQTLFLPAVFIALDQYVLPNPNSFTHFLHPIAWAGWILTLITFLNAFPIGQLDGGHVLRALLGKKWHHRLSYVMAGIMILAGWWEMAILTVLLLRAFHPGSLDDVTSVSKNRKFASILLVIIFVACFTVTPASPLLTLIGR